jgi:hypothetical protein
MNTIRIAALALLASSSGLCAQTADRVWFTGASNLRSFACESRSVGKALALREGATTDELMRGEPVVASASVEVPSGSFHCGIAQQNRHLRHTLGAEEHPLIRFWLLDYRFLEPGRVAMQGKLEVGGVERIVEVTATVAGGDGAPRITGSHRIRPSDFAIRPPRRFLGLLRVRDEVVVHFDLALAPGEPLAAR